MTAERMMIEGMYSSEVFRQMRVRRAEALSAYLIPYLEEGQTVLEIGTGKGDIYNLMSQRYPRQFYSIDVKDQVVSVNNTGDTRLVADGLNLPFQDKQFNLTYTCAVWHHLPNKIVVPFIAESLRVGQSGLVIEDSIDDQMFGSMELRRQWVRGLDSFLNVGVPGGQAANQRTTPEWNRLIEEAGARITDIARFQHPALGVIPVRHVVYKMESCGTGSK